MVRYSSNLLLELHGLLRSVQGFQKYSNTNPPSYLFKDCWL